MSVTTTKILARKALDRACGQECVDWAISLLERGYSMRNIEILAGMMPPFNHFEIAQLRNSVLLDIGAPELSHGDAVHAYAGELAAEVLRNDADMVQLVAELADLCIAEGYPPELYDSYLLYNAWQDLRSAEIQWYVTDATRENIDSLIREHLVAMAIRAKMSRV
jgi:hypothetical protein